MKRTTLALAAILALGTTSVASTGAATAETLTVTASNNGAGVQLAASYRYRIMPRRFVRIQLRRRGYYRIHRIRLVRRHYRRHHGRHHRRFYRAYYVATAYKFGRRYRVYVNARNGRPFRTRRIR